MHEDGTKIDLLTHIPLTKQGSKRMLFKRIEIPYFLNADQTSHYWNIPRQGKLIMTDDARKSAHSMDETELTDCIKIGDTYYCQQVAKQMNTIDAQCESQLFMKQLDRIKEK